LARAVASESAAEFGEGTRIIDLTRVDSAPGVSESVAAQLGYASFRAMMDAPGDHSVLLLVDNCEHVLDAAAEIVERVLDACQMPTVLATSRTALDVPGETVIPVVPLGLPPPGTTVSPAVSLFLERARDAGAEPEPTEPVAELCRRLDGVPLAIELAAARARAMTPAEMLARLGGGLEVLDRPRRRSARRHQSLHAAIAWSYDLLGVDQQRLFDRLSVFTGPFTATDAHVVTSEPGAGLTTTQDLLDDLVAASMVVADPSGDTTWYRELGTLRAFARDALDRSGEAHAIVARLVDHVVDRVTGIVLRGAATWDADALGELLASYDTIAGVLRWCTRHDDRPDRALLLTAALWGVVHQAHTEETGRLAEAVLARWPDGGHELLADAHATAATCRYMLGDLAGAVALAHEGLAVADRSPYAPVTLRRAIAQAVRAGGDTAGGLAWFAEAAVAARERGLTALAVEADAARAQILADIAGAGVADVAEGDAGGNVVDVADVAHVADVAGAGVASRDFNADVVDAIDVADIPDVGAGGHDDGGLDAALAVLDAARAEAEDAGAPVATAWTRAVEGTILLRVDVDRAEAVLVEALETCRGLRYAGGTSVALRSRVLAALCRGDVPAAAARVLELLDDVLARGSSYELRMVLDVASPLLRLAGRDRPAADLAATALTLPVVSITASVGHELMPLDPTGGAVLGIREAILCTRAEVTALVAERAPTEGGALGVDPGTDSPPSGDGASGEPRPGAVSGDGAVRVERVGVFRRGGDYWEVGFGGELAAVRHGKGMADLARLLASPGQEVHCLDLVGGVDEQDTGEVVDAAARRAYEQRVRDLQAEIDEADATHDRGRAERARVEMDAVVDQLTAALGLGGRARRAGGAAERARSTVTQRIRSTIRRIEPVDPRLARHLQVSVRTGVFCAYAPDEPVRWDV
ncbi:MAG TPA: hypothetical protein VFY82_13320, partial [Acidimicrobiales bacterium]|nr:hypothetical protein [Acidimicrobiales bacterium]